MNSPGSTLTTEEETTPLAGKSGPAGPIVNPLDCLGYGKELPSDWYCGTCPLAKACYEVLERKNGASNGTG